jgi:hypothetical protein
MDAEELLLIPGLLLPGGKEFILHLILKNKEGLSFFLKARQICFEVRPAWETRMDSLPLPFHAFPFKKLHSILPSSLYSYSFNA